MVSSRRFTRRPLTARSDDDSGERDAGLRRRQMTPSTKKWWTWIAASMTAVLNASDLPKWLPRCGKPQNSANPPAMLMAIQRVDSDHT